ncbi:UDP-2,4-diacetamido-2,4,6-trideoxy-beta-L-altropyranose hydrolase [Crenobacter sp. SG2303]|uniref:UDP-2,4-diacetamido-2,4, 6-trideoxy-beta-L-altropyranose hydrolase n=1 Tax=Crenobacter oryzisoli TaxID=3056844 RepID=A0ABT7XPW8_9NEIS|nr:UDP-2,4-diacetamido-2,4,6-trideoxy-beta-L-altropyranose hydrolase [Crenobacter sp. SG2303]MDN0075827.1 UDP-2,4-diacetamido-2,4,6-trideoxy-beta-L-altropyranose hydrolase [Crenobacter sp. SG2303]
MKVAFRVDASLDMGTGHVMRCLTVADALKARGAECHFLCRAHRGNLIELIRNKGYDTYVLDGSEPQDTSSSAMKQVSRAPQPAHAAWLGTSQEQDAAECVAILRELQADWLIVDHYALDARWESELKPYCRHLLAIDDLADRPHVCDLLLDQTFSRSPSDYASWVPAGCILLCGSQYALLRPEFAELRPYSLQRREKPRLEHLLITMGGVDKDNATGRILEALRLAELPAHCRITVVMGANAPWLAKVRQQAEQMPWSAEVRVAVDDMARLMADCDLAIGAAGATSWERCCLGLPTVMVVLADNQRHVADGLEQAGAALVLQHPAQIPDRLPGLLNSLFSSPQRGKALSLAAAHIADGRGAEALVRHMESLN